MSTQGSVRTRVGSTASRVNKDMVSESGESYGDGVGMWETQNNWRNAKSNKRYVCKGDKNTCGLVLAKGDDSVRCDWCEDWYHPKCQGLSVDAYTALTKYDIDWMCSGCRPNFMSLTKRLKELESKIEETQAEIMKAVPRKKDVPRREDIIQDMKDRFATLEKTAIGNMKE